MAFPWGALLSAGGSIFGGMLAGQGYAQAGRLGQLAQKDQLEIGAMMDREKTKAITAAGIDRGVSPFLYMPYQMEQERKQFEYMSDTGRGKKRSQDFKDAEAALAFRGLPGFGAMKRSEMQRAFDRAKGMSMFDPQARMFGQISIPRA